MSEHRTEFIANPTQKRFIHSRAEAAALGLAQYQGRPCRKGHDGTRYVSDRSCVKCKAAHRKQWQRENRGRAREFCRTWRQRNPERSRLAQKSHYHRNREKRLSNYKSWLERNREYRRQYGRDLYQRNPAHFSAKTARREADKRQRMPVWANQADIDFFYECRPAGFHVDHIVPLRGENVSGLHVAENLQWLPASVNVAKGNRWEVA